MTRPFAVLAALIPGFAVAHEGAIAHPHPHGIESGWVVAVAVLGAGGAFAWGHVRGKRK